MAMLTEIAGTFCKIAFADAVDVLLARGMASRPAARFNRPGQDALYLSPDETSARVAISEYVKADDPPRVLLRYAVEPCVLFDLRLPANAAVYALASQSWQTALRNGEAPRSWDAADHVRRSGYTGLIDPSRRRPGLWHITLLRWNEPGAPVVRPIAPPMPIVLRPDER